MCFLWGRLVFQTPISAARARAVASGQGRGYHLGTLSVVRRPLAQATCMV